MAKFKRVFASLLVFALMLGTMASAVKYPDVSNDYQYAQEVEFLSDLGVLAGYPDGTFGTEDTLTRVQAAAIVFRMLTNRTDATLYNGPTQFSDVAESYWGTGYINYARNIGAIGGYPDGTFRPDQPITVAEFESMLVRALGLTEGKSLAYPGGYISIADANGINDGIPSNIGNDTPANRGLVAKLTYNTINNATYATLATKDDPDPKVLEKVFKLTDEEGVIVTTGKYTLGSYDGITGSISAFEEDDKISYVAFDENGKLIDAVKTITSAKADKELLGTNAKIYRRTEGTDKNKAFAVVPTNKNKIVTLKNSEIFGTDTANKYYYKDANGEKVYFTVSAKTHNFKDYASQGASVNFGYVRGEGVAKDKAGDKALIKFTLVSNNDNNTDIEYVFAQTYTVGEYDGTYNDKMYFKDLENTKVENGINEITLKDGNTVENVNYPADLEKGEAVMVYQDVDYAEVTRLENISGELTSIVGGNKYTIGGTTYEYAIDSQSGKIFFTGNKPTVSDLNRTFGALIVPGFGAMVKTTTSSATPDDFLYVTGSKISNDYGKITYKVQGVNVKGEKLEYTVDTDATITATVKSGSGTISQGTAFDASKLENISYSDTAALLLSAFKDQGSFTASKEANEGDRVTFVYNKATAAANPTMTPEVFKVEMNSSNKITKASIEGTPVANLGDSVALSKNAYNSSSNLFKFTDSTNAQQTVKVTSNSVFFFDKKGDGDEVKVYVGTMPAVSSSNKLMAMNVKATDNPNTVKTAVIKGEAKGATSTLENIPGVIVGDYSIVAAEDGKFQVEMTILAQGEKKTYKTTPVEKNDAQRIVNNMPTNTLVKFDLTADGLVAVQDDESETFMPVTGFTAEGITTGIIPGTNTMYLDGSSTAGNTALIANGGVLAMGNNLIGIGSSQRDNSTGSYQNPDEIHYYTLSDDVKVYELDANNSGNGIVSSTGAIRVIPNSDKTTTTMNKAMLVFDVDDVKDLNKAQVVAIYYFK